MRKLLSLHNKYLLAKFQPRELRGDVTPDKAELAEDRLWRFQWTACWKWVHNHNIDHKPRENISLVWWRTCRYNVIYVGT